jgi:hypothetical protein
MPRTVSCSGVYRKSKQSSSKIMKRCDPMFCQLNPWLYSHTQKLAQASFRCVPVHFFGSAVPFPRRNPLLHQCFLDMAGRPALLLDWRALAQIHTGPAWFFDVSVSASVSFHPQLTPNKLTP